MTAYTNPDEQWAGIHVSGELARKQADGAGGKAMEGLRRAPDASIHEAKGAMMAKKHHGMVMESAHEAAAEHKLLGTHHGKLGHHMLDGHHHSTAHHLLHGGHHSGKSGKHGGKMSHHGRHK